MTIFNFEPMPIDFFKLPTLKLAKALLGCKLVKDSEDGMTAGYIVETEAYVGPMDRAAHSYQNRRTRRTEIMFAEAGRIYTYVMHTHCLVNVVSGDVGYPEAVLIRAVEPSHGIAIMQNRRGMTDERNLTNGPGKLTKALGITMDDYGGTFRQPPLIISKGYTPISIASGSRIGIDNAGEAKDYPWRFWITGNRFVSRRSGQPK